MLITFHSKVAAEVLMRTDDAAPLLRAAGKSFRDTIPERGVFTADQLQSAITGLERAIAAADRGPADDDEPHPDKEPVHPIERAVGLHQRAFPLLDMMRKTAAAGADLTWEVSRGW